MWPTDYFWLETRTVTAIEKNIFLMFFLSTGPDGCLQYFTGTSGTVSSFNFPTTSATIGSTGLNELTYCKGLTEGSLR